MSFIEINNDEIAYSKDDNDKLVVLQSSTNDATTSTLKVIIPKTAAKTITGITKAAVGVVTATAHGFENDDIVYISNVVGMVEVNGKLFTVKNKNTNDFQLFNTANTPAAIDTSTSNYTAYTSGGKVQKIINFNFPSTLPADTNAKFLVSDTNGNMSFAESGGTASIDGDFSDTHVGGTGIDDNKTINGAITQLDTWIFDNLVSSPPKPLNVQFLSNSTTTMTIIWDSPKIYQIGFLENKTIPFITSLSVSIYKNDAASASLSNGGTVTHTTNTTLTGSGTQFTSDISIGDSITVPGATWTTGHPKVKGGSQSGTTLLTDGWTANPSSFAGHVFTIVGHYGEYIIESVSGSWSDNTTEITLTLDRTLTSSPNDDSDLINQETKVVVSIESNTSLTVDSNWANTVGSGQTPSFISYVSSPSQTFTTTTVDQLPRETANNNIESLKFYIDGGSNQLTGISNGKVISFNASSAVSTSNNTITLTAHPFNTGNSITYSDGGGTQISGLTDGTQYFIIKVNANTIKLATNFANALSNTAISITAGSSETHTLTRRKKKYDLVDSPAILNTDILKFRIHYGNHNSNQNLFNYAYLADQQFITPGVPSAPKNLTKSGTNVNSIALRFNPPDDNDVNVAGNQSTPAIDNYRIVYLSNALASGTTYRFGGAVTHNSTTVTHNHSGGGTQSKTISSLQAGQLYDVTVSAKNTINAGYGSSVNNNSTLVTSIPSGPSTFASASLARSVSKYTQNARTLGSHSQITQDILKQNTIGGTTFSYTTLSNRRVNETNANNLESVIHRFETTFGSSVDIGSGQLANFKAFASPFTYASSTTINGTHTKLTLNNHQDAGSGTTAGYWSKIDLTPQVVKASIPASTNLYTFKFRKMVSDSSINEKTDTFYCDDLAQNPAITAVVFQSFPADTNARWVSGVPSRGHGFQIRFTPQIQRLGKHFIRFDKFADIRLKNNSTNFVSSTISPSGITTFPYSDTSGNATAPIDQSKSISLANINLTYSDPGSGIHTQSTATYVNLSVTPHNIFGSGTEYKKNGINNSNELDDSGKKIYVDTVSTRYIGTSVTNNATTYKGNNYGKASSGSNPRKHYPIRRILTNGWDGSAVVDTPSVGSTGDHAEFDNSNSLISGIYQAELQFVNGRVRTKQESTAYLNYPSTFLDPGLGTMPNYSGISGTGYRFITFQYDISSGSAATINYLDLKFKNFSGLTHNSSGTVQNIKLFAKLIQGTDYTPTVSNRTTIWLDCNSILDGAVSRSQTNYSNSGFQPLAVLENTSSGNTNNNNNNTSTKRISVVTGTSTTSMTLLLRLGINMAQNISMGHIEVECPSS